MNNKGWVKFHRVQFSNWISKKPFCDGYAWTYLYTQANHKKGMVNFRNEYIKIERGQFLTSKLKLQRIFGWTYRHVENFLLALKNDENIIYRTTNRYIVITIVNYDIYQSYAEQNDEQNDEQSKNRLGTDYKRGNTNKNVKNVKNVKKEDKVSSIIKEIVDYLNKKIGTDYQPTTELTRKLIKARLKEGNNIDAFKWVIDVKYEEWKGKHLQDGKDCEDWLRPKTLFSNNFEGYLNQSKKEKPE